MGVPAVAGVREIKPAPPKWLKPNDKIYNATDASVVKIDTKKLMKLMKELRNTQTEDDLSDCIHVINPNRMVDMEGCTFMGVQRHLPSMPPMLAPFVMKRTAT